MQQINELLQKILLIIFKNSKLKNYIVFESAPTYSDNTKYVFDEMIRRGLNKKYKCYWFVGNDQIGKKLSINNIDNVYFIDAYHNGIIRNFIYSAKKTRIICSAKAVIMCNKMLVRGNNQSRQYYVNLAHGEALKNCRGHYNLKDSVDEVMCLSKYLAKYDAINFNCEESLMCPLGYARNDVLFGEKIDLRKIFSKSKFDKVIYWLPTYRLHSKTGLTVSNIAFPIIYNEQISEIINDYAKQNRVLIIVKPHPAQDLSKLKSLKLSNLIFINDSFLKENNIENYELLRSSDAMITDYSSVYYDYLLCDKPIGLCFDDFEEYSAGEGFTVDPDYILAGGEKIYNTQDMCDFIGRIADGKDLLKEQRTKIKNLCHLYQDNKSAERIVNHIEEKLNNMN